MIWTLKKVGFATNEKVKAVEFLQEKGLILKEKLCIQCGNKMVLHLGTWDYWRCQKLCTKHKRKRAKCEWRVSIRRETWFAQSKLGYGTIMELTYMLIHNFEQVKIVHELELSSKAVNSWAGHVRQVVTEWAMSSTEMIGGEGTTVEIDESKFGRRKYHRGHAVEGQWVFGGIERDSGKLFLVPVESRDRETLTAIIKQWIRPGTTIISDCWKAYDKLGNEGYAHLTVNHSLNFKDPVTGAHTNGIESTWRHAKNFLPKYSRKKKNYNGYLSHYMFVKRAKSESRDLFEYFLEEISKLRFDPDEEGVAIEEGEPLVFTDSESEDEIE